jgi:uncharacterized protein (TIGR03435 family)
MTVHRESKDLAVDAIVAGKGGAKLGSPKPEGQSNIAIDRGKMVFQNYTLAKLADFLSQRSVDRPIIDATGIEGTYDFAVQLTDTPADNPMEVKVAMGRIMRDGSMARIVVEQLGLRMETRKGPAEIVVVDRAERMPIEN